MDKQEFVNRLRLALSGALPEALVTDHVNYYRDYIEAEMAKGQTEAHVLGTLGDPRLIARTILQTSQVEAESQNTGGYDNNYTGENSSYRDVVNRSGRSDVKSRSKVVSVPGWVWALVGIVLVIMVLGIVMSVLSFLAPILLPVIVVIFLVKLFRDWLN